MSIFSFNVQTPMLQGIAPRQVQLVTTDSLATITTAGYMNKNGQVLQGENLSPTDVINVIYLYVASTNSGTFGIFTPSIASNGTITLVQWANPGDVLLPVVSGDFANFNGTTGQISDAGFSPSNAAKTKVVMANGAVILNHIGTFTDTAGTLGDDAATAINGGNLQAGLSGTAGTLSSFPATAANGSLVLAAVNAGGAFTTTISNGTMGQSTVYSMGDIGATTGGLVVATSAIRMKAVAGATAAGGAAAQSFTDTFCTSGSNVIGNWNTQANVASVLKIVPGNGSFVVTSSADAGAGTFNYIITK
jgi:hypothetical protein